MPEPDHRNRSRHQKTRRRAVMVALLGAGAPLAQKTLTGGWVTPVVDTVLVPAHAVTTLEEEEMIFPTGNFGPVETIGNSGSSVFSDIAGRTEEQILDFFVRPAEAATVCGGMSCDQDFEFTVEVVGTFDQNPGEGCVQARVSTDAGTCVPRCTIFDFDATVDGQTVAVDDSECQLQLAGVTLTQAGLSGSWSFTGGGTFGNLPTGEGDFFAPVNGIGCGSIGCP